MSGTSNAHRKPQSPIAPEQLRELEELLTEEQRRLLKSYQRAVEREKKIAFDEGGEDFVDRAEKSWGREELLALGEADRDRLLLVEEALERMKDGSYGLCFFDDDPIPVPRLKAVPWARYCAAHQEDLESGRIEESPLGRLRRPRRAR